MSPRIPSQCGTLLLLMAFLVSMCPPVYAAGKAATSGAPSIYGPSIYTHLSPAKTPPPPPAMIPMGPTYGYPGDFDRNSSGEARGKPDKGWGRARREHGKVGVPSFAPESLTTSLSQLVATALRYRSCVTWTAVSLQKCEVATGSRLASRMTP